MAEDKEDQGKSNTEDQKPELFGGLYEEAAKKTKRKIDKALGDDPSTHPRKTIAEQAKERNKN